MCRSREQKSSSLITFLVFNQSTSVFGCRQGSCLSMRAQLSPSISSIHHEPPYNLNTNVAFTVCWESHLTTLLMSSSLDSGLPRWLSGKESACQCGRHGFGPWVGKIPWRRNRKPTQLQYSCLEISMDRGAWPAAVYGGAKSQTQLSD